MVMSETNGVSYLFSVAHVARFYCVVAYKKRAGSVCDCDDLVAALASLRTKSPRSVQVLGLRRLSVDQYAVLLLAVLRKPEQFGAPCRKVVLLAIMFMSFGCSSGVV